MSANTSVSRVTVVTEVEDDAAGLEATAASLAAQTFVDWEWAIVTTAENVALPADDARIRLVREPSRAHALKDAVGGSGDVALVEPGQSLPPTALEKWLWFLASDPSCDSVHSTTPGVDVRTPRLIRRSAIVAAGGLDAAAELARASRGFVPLPDARTESHWGHRAPEHYQAANEWLPIEPAIENRVETSGRRLLLIAPWMTIGGADKFNLDLLGQLGPLGWEVTVATTIDGHHELYRDYERRTPDLFPLAHFLPLTYHPAFLRYLIESRKPDVVLVSNSELGYRLLPYLRGMCPGTPLVDFCHSEAEHWNNGGYPRFSVEYGQLLDLTLTASEHLKRWMVDRGGDEDVHAFQPSAEARVELRRRLRMPPDEPVVLFVGRVSEDKQPRVLAAALIRLHERGARFTAVIAGEGPDKRRLEVALGKAGLGEGVRMLGAVDATDVPSLMAAADVLFIPSRSEGISLALYEAMASGTPVVGARVGGQAELVTEACGFLVDRATPEEEAERYADAIELLLRDSERRTAMGSAARHRAETFFPLERMGARVNELLEHAIELHRTTPRPVPSPALARNSATETVELMRLAWLMDAAWTSRLQRRSGVRGVGVSAYVLLHRVGRPAYLWGVRRGWTWLPRVRDTLARVLAGYTA
jgi:glycosyltransferase involved in cell wall biosynthesis